MSWWRATALTILELLMDNPPKVPATFHVENAESAQLPQRYEAARTAIAECDRIDECKTWADKHAALVSYGIQAKDDSLVVYARRIQARALRRAGELLQQYPPASEGNLVQHRQDGTVPSVTRTQAATDAGLSERQRKTALRVAAIPVEDFDYAIESQDPPTVTALAVLGTQARPQPAEIPDANTPAEHAEVVESIQAVYTFFQYCERTDPIRLALGTPSNIAKLTRNEVQIIDSWLDRFVASLPA
jgi:hypothetical protein